ncbi:hypothetical protein SLE2022_188170 [Rubroshorea leprosula]
MASRKDVLCSRFFQLYASSVFAIKNYKKVPLINLNHPSVASQMICYEFRSLPMISFVHFLFTPSFTIQELSETTFRLLALCTLRKFQVQIQQGYLKESSSESMRQSRIRNLKADDAL